MNRTQLQEVREDARKVERALLVGIQFPHSTPAEVDELLAELAELTATLGVAVAERVVCKLQVPRTRYLVGSGKAEELAELIREHDLDVIIFDEPLTPSQQRNLENLTQACVIDRAEVILDIFGQRAQTREAVLQVQLAQAHYHLPRLKRRWTHLSRQRGGGSSGNRGEGEQQLEVDARLVRLRISKLTSQLEEVRKQRSVQRQKRLRKPVPIAAIVGYTNAGKSSLLNAMTEAEVLVEDKLFATLDPTVRRVVLPSQQELLLSDTVGFIRKLPHSLVEAFKATLEEVVIADFLVEVLDASDPSLHEHHTTTDAVLADLDAQHKQRLLVFNKIDLLEETYVRGRLRRRYPEALFVSARTGEGLPELRERLASLLEPTLAEVHVNIPHQRGDLIAYLHRSGNILAENYDDDGASIHATVPSAAAHVFEEFAQKC